LTNLSLGLATQLSVSDQPTLVYAYRQHHSDVSAHCEVSQRVHTAGLGRCRVRRAAISAVSATPRGRTVIQSLVDRDSSLRCGALGAKSSQPS